MVLARADDYVVPLAASLTLSLHPFILFLPLIDHQGLPTTDHRGLPLPVAGSQSPPALEAQSNFVEEGGLHMSALLSYFLISLFSAFIVKYSIFREICRSQSTV